MWTKEIDMSEMRVFGTTFAGKVVVVTGAGGGIASAVIELFASLGASLVLLEVNADALCAAVTRMEPLGCELLPIVCDITSEESLSNAVQLVGEQFGRCDVIVNNAGILPRASSIQTLELDAWNRAFAINVTGAFLVIKHFGKLMLAQESGSIVNVASIAGYSPNGCPPYGSTKAAVLELTRHMAVEWGPRGIRTNAVCPGFIQTELSKDNYANADMVNKRISSVPLRRLGTTQEIAKAVVFLASEEASFINGQDLIVDGGFLQANLMHVQPPAEQYGGWQPTEGI